MPDIDGGHYFLTALVPVSTGVRTRPDRRKIASSHALRETLATLPTALQSSADVSGQAVSPFARCTRTHFVRLFVIDQPFFNGRTATDALVRPEIRAAFRRMIWLGLTDALRALHPHGPVYTFWDYQAGCWPRDRGLRIDHALLSPTLAEHLVSAMPDRAERGEEQPSDHVPLVIELA